MINYQRSIRKAISVEGVGLHSGEAVRLTLSPAAADTGIIFRGPDGTLIPATPDHVVDSRWATTLGAFGVRVRTIEHLMAAASALGVDNLVVDVSAEEVPAMDGSARPFVELLYQAGLAELPAERRPIVVRHPIRVADGGRWIEIVPAEELRISYTLDNSHPAVGLQVATLAVDEPTFVEEVAPARTYGFLKDVPTMRKNGLALGGSLENAIVVGKRIILNPGLRFRDEFVRHKVLDLVGDLFLLGRPVVGHVVARNGGHALNYQLVAELQRALAADRLRAGVRGGTRPVAPGGPRGLRDRLVTAPGVAAL